MCLYDVMCGNVRQCVLLCCSVWQRDAVYDVGFEWRLQIGEDTATNCNPLHPTANHGYTLLHTATHCNTLQHTTTHCNTMQHTATHCSTLQHTATCCNMLQHTATHCNTLQHTATHLMHSCNVARQVFKSLLGHRHRYSQKSARYSLF